MSSSAKCNILSFILVETTRYLVDVFICLFLDHTQCSHYYWHSSSFKVPHFLNFYFQVFVFITIIIIIILLKSFPISFIRCSFNGVWVIASLLTSLGLFSVFGIISTCPLISNTSSPLSFGEVPSAPIMFPVFLCSGGGDPHGVMVKVLDCRIIVSRFELQPHFRQIPLGKVWTPLSSYGLNSTTAVLLEGWLWD